jgi:membrane-associated phospholipid phosphatase
VVGISRIFVGVHFPLDVLSGAVLGTVEGTIAAWLMIKLCRMGKLKPEPYIW